jgi:26S proteasome non-ATPase regulatory subunit 9
VKELTAQKDEIEKQIRQHQQSLEAIGVGMDKPLVDREGFPRADIDVHAVRIERHAVIQLQNDHKGLMAQIEIAIQRLHEEARRLQESV